mmetsp:Transcript_32454/g.79030  ORF Transcript_32454/g.79030 Transcript_32454/m.79030 type:complete len:98 (-) Transcript_32454:401-694(-)
MTSSSSSWLLPEVARVESCLGADDDDNEVGGGKGEREDEAFIDSIFAISDSDRIGEAPPGTGGPGKPSAGFSARADTPARIPQLPPKGALKGWPPLS